MLTNELRYFFAVATSGSLSTASEQLFVAGSAISRQIQKLEARLGVTLFERHARGMVLTDAGQILANHVRKSMRDMEFALAEIQGLKAVRKALVRIACTDGMAFDLLPGLLARFRQQHPGVNFDLQVGTALQVAQWIRHNECDVAFQFSLAPERDVEIIAAWPAPVLLLLDAGHPLTQQPSVTLDLLHHYPLVLPEAGTTIRQLFDLSCRMAGTFLEPTFSSNNFSALYEFTRHTAQAITVCSHFSVLWRARLDAMTLKAINNTSLSQRTLQIQAPGSRHRPAAVETFLQMATQMLAGEHSKWMAQLA
ncbi:DNA-binding transcriptional regulator, LysR family [Kosakonia arachidis]|uniref:DNA-binding transcriptional regulator, LysR family n=1 Tax=Kosakonia arachidis TaxID=551989 RepID=A0A1I6Y9G3_9ENTR|nr:LysR family transcriptional regulator [Kosakonia arachidis]SFT47108.1 DNA-binding transcriptional regulator, LysR family [Kosakonia arachidis]